MESLLPVALSTVQASVSAYINEEGGARDIGARDKQNISMAPTLQYPVASSPRQYQDGLKPLQFNNDDFNLKVLLDKESLSMVPRDYVKRLHHNAAHIGQAREMAVAWILNVQPHLGFHPQTALVALNYMDRFLSCYDIVQYRTTSRAKAWALHLACVACLSLAAKMEEPHVPLLLDLQVGRTEYVFEARSVQRMELIVLGALQWQMMTVTPLSYLEYGTHILGLQDPQLRSTFLLRCSEAALCAAKEASILAFRPSVVAAAIILSATREMGCLSAANDHLLCGLSVEKAVVEECSELLKWLLHPTLLRKRKPCHSCFSMEVGSPRGVLDASLSSQICSSSKSTANLSHRGDLSAVKKTKAEYYCPSIGRA